MRLNMSVSTKGICIKKLHTQKCVDDGCIEDKIKIIIITGFILIVAIILVTIIKFSNLYTWIT